MVFLNFASGPPTWAKFKTHKKVVRTTFDFIYKYIYTWSIYPQSIKKIEGHFWYYVPPHQEIKHFPEKKKVTVVVWFRKFQNLFLTKTRRKAPRCVNCAGPRRESVPARWVYRLGPNFCRTRCMKEIPLKWAKKTNQILRIYFNFTHEIPLEMKDIKKAPFQFY